MERRQFLGTTLALGAAGSALLTGCASGNPQPAAAVPSPQPAGGLVRLNANENPLGLSPVARDALLRDLGEANRYPRQLRTDLVAALAARHGVAAEQITLGAGSTEILQIVVQNTPPDAVIVVAEPTFEDVGRYAATAGRRTVAVPLLADGSHDLERMRSACGAGPAMVFICNPNNPTGTLTSCDQVDAWIRSAPERVTFVVDEAYFEFATDPAYRTSVPFTSAQPNVIVSRTFSKIYGMAGLRLGYAVAHATTTERLRALACGNNANELALAAGLAAMSDTAFQQRTLSVNSASRELLTRALDQLGLAHLPSHTNFVMHRIPGELTAYNARMREAGFWVGRPFPPMLGYSRVSLGVPDDMERFTRTLRDFRERAWV